MRDTSAIRILRPVNRRLFDLARLLVAMPEWLIVRSVTIESAQGNVRVPVPFPPDYVLPLPEGAFSIRIEVDPTSTGE